MKCPSTADLHSRSELANSPHVRECPRCAARLLALKEFHHPTDALDEPTRESVERELRARLADAVGTGHPPRLRPPGRLRALLLGSTAVAALALLFWQMPNPPADPPTTRSASESPGARLVLGADSRWDGSSLSLEWNGVPGAESYQVVVYDAGLRELRVQEVGGELRWESTLEAPGSSAIWVRLRAVDGSGVPVESDLVALTR